MPSGWYCQRRAAFPGEPRCYEQVGSDCGDGVRDAWEACDDEDFGDDRCLSRGFAQGILTCGPGCDAESVEGCWGGCGNGAREGREECDGADLGDRSCTDLGWYEAYAFCIWDGGFLPTEAEWNYAAAGGSQQRVYPWSNPPTSATIDCTYANYYNDSPCAATYTTNVGTESPKGDGRWGQVDLAGNVYEWALDRYSGYPTPCTNCALLSTGNNRVYRGGSYSSIVTPLRSSYRGSNLPTYRGGRSGIRCARTP